MKIVRLLMIAAIVAASVVVFSGCSKKPINAPSLTTLTVSDITSVSATAGGNISDDGGADIKRRGVFYSTVADVKRPVEDPNYVMPPGTELKQVTANDVGTGLFTVNLTGLRPATTYYLVAFAGNQAAVSFGNEVSFTTAAAE